MDPCCDPPRDRDLCLSRRPFSPGPIHLDFTGIHHPHGSVPSQALHTPGWTYGWKTFDETLRVAGCGQTVHTSGSYRSSWLLGGADGVGAVLGGVDHS